MIIDLRKVDPTSFRKTFRFLDRHVSSIAYKRCGLKWYVYFEKPL
jgi:hypothetical protein